MFAACRTCEVAIVRSPPDAPLRYANIRLEANRSRSRDDDLYEEQDDRNNSTSTLFRRSRIVARIFAGRRDRCRDIPQCPTNMVSPKSIWPLKGRTSWCTLRVPCTTWSVSNTRLATSTTARTRGRGARLLLDDPENLVVLQAEAGCAVAELDVRWKMALPRVRTNMNTMSLRSTTITTRMSMTPPR